MRKLLVGFVLVVLVSAAAYFRFHHAKGPRETAYVGSRQVTLWSTSAQVREPVGTVSYGERLEILDRFQDQLHVRTANGLTGWITQSDLLTSEMWKKAKDLESGTGTLPVEARGHTRALSNLHIGPGRESPRIRQLNKMIPVDLFERQVAEVPQAPTAVSTKEAVPDASPDAPAPAAKKEDWWLVRAHLSDETTVSGWLLGRFVDLDVPSPLPDYANSAGMHIVAWFELNRVVDTSGERRPQYLLVGSRSAEGQPCDFSLMRVYTWGKRKQRYETAFVESDLCGRLPVKVTEPAAPGADVTFSFEDWSAGSAQQRIYVMRQTIVKQLRQNGAPSTRKHAHR
jgi:hypothetical protein